MGGGGLRILGHKTWHVWRRDNIERVLRDEREHEEAQQARLASERRSEQEQRAQELLQRNRSKAHATDDLSAADSEQHVQRHDATTHEHINLFQQEQEQQERQILDAASGDNRRRRARTEVAANETLGKHGHLPWYAKRSAGDNEDVNKSPSERRRSSRREQKRKRALDAQDPLQHMRPQRASGSNDDDDDDDDDRRSKRRSHKHVRRSHNDIDERTRREYKSEYKRSARKFSATTNKTPTQNVRDALRQQLRHEREEREQRERERAKSLLRRVL